MNSIRKFLLVGTLATLTLFNFIAALRGYQSSMREADTLMDNQLLDLASLVANLDYAALPRDYHLGSNLAFQVWQGERLLAATHQAPDVPINTRVPGFDFSNFDGYRWRTHTREAGRDDRWIIVAERADQRFVLAENVVLEAVVPIVLGIPLAGLLLWVLVGRGLRPLEQLSSALRLKQANDLAPLSTQGIPAELAQVVQSTNGFINRLSAALDREKRFSADAAHELRTPISALKVQMHNLVQEVPPGSEAFAQLRQGVERMQHLVEQLLSLYRSTPDQFDASCVDVDLDALAQDVIAGLYPMVEQRGQSLELEGESALVHGDPFALGTLMSNLLANAIKYTPDGGTIVASISRHDGEVVFRVRDDGPGISDEEKSRIFERFYRRDDPGTQAQPGCGLGLAIVQHVATLHRARVEVSDAPGGGAVFTVVFPEARGA